MIWVKKMPSNLLIPISGLFSNCQYRFQNQNHIKIIVHLLSYLTCFLWTDRLLLIFKLPIQFFILLIAIVVPDCTKIKITWQLYHRHETMKSMRGDAPFPLSFLTKVVALIAFSISSWVLKPIAASSFKSLVHLWNSNMILAINTKLPFSRDANQGFVGSTWVPCSSLCLPMDWNYDWKWNADDSKN